MISYYSKLFNTLFINYPRIIPPRHHQCMGHKIGDVSTILCYEFNDDWLDINNIIKTVI